jgi:hypothetical protein
MEEPERGGIFQFVIHLNVMLVALVVEDISSHPVQHNSDHTFFPGFLHTMADPCSGFYTSASYHI